MTVLRYLASCFTDVRPPWWFALVLAVVVLVCQTWLGIDRGLIGWRMFGGPL